MNTSFQASDEMLRGAAGLYRSGRIAEAETACRRILSGEPRHAGALHLLGVVVGRRGDLNGAVKLVAQAVSELPEFVAAHLTLGQLYVSLKDLPKAIVSFQRVAALRPADPPNWYSLGIVQRMNRDSNQAIASFQKALVLDPGSAEAHVELGALLMLKGQFAEALESFTTAAAARPDSAEFQNNLAAALMEVGRLEEAEAAFRRAIELSPQGAIYHANIGNFFMKSYSYEKALQAYATAIGLDPRMARAYAGRGSTLARMNRFDEAIADHQTGLSLVPNDPKMHVSLAWVLMQVGQTTTAEQHCRRALELDSESAPAWHALGSVLRAVGRFDEATTCFNRSVELCPTAAVYMLLSSTQQEVDAGEAERLLAFSRRPELSVEDRSCAEFALGKLLDNSDRFDEAFAHYKIGNELVKDFWNQRGICFKLSEYHQTVSAMRQTFTPDFFGTVGDWGQQTELPVFIVGMPRSGTTLVEQIAASHSQVFGAGELSDISSYWTGLALTPDADGRYPIEREQVGHAAAEYKKKILSLGGSSTRVIDKMPGNITYLGYIATLFPNARVIFCQRDPLDNCLSCYFQRFNKDHQIFSYDLVDCAQRYLEQAKLQAHWQQVLPLRMMTIQYEGLVGDLEGQSRRLIEFLGLPWEPRCLDFHKTDRTVLTSSVWQVRQPIYTRSVGRWKHYEKHLGPLLEALGNDKH